MIALGIVLIGGSGKIAEYNCAIRGQEAAKARDAEAEASAFFTRMRLGFYKSSVEAGRSDRFCFVQVGIATIGMGVFALFQPGG